MGENMGFDREEHHRRSVQLHGYDYTQAGAYFITICTRDRECLLSDPVVSGILVDVWHSLPKWFPGIALDAFVVMPNHVHFVIWLHLRTTTGADHDTAAITCADVAWPAVMYPRASPAPTEGDGVSDSVGVTLAVTHLCDWIIPEPQKANPEPTIGDVVGTLKSLVFRVYRDWLEIHDPNRYAAFWQRNYDERVIRSDEEMRMTRQYIIDNPAHWAQDENNPAKLGLQNQVPPARGVHHDGKR